tara:strand:+ start:2714 stop:2971 length:258 start_codon:yes stop_codon:yes gene_type:complete
MSTVIKYLAYKEEFLHLPTKLQSKMKQARDLAFYEMEKFDGLEPTSAFRQMGSDLLPKNISDDNWSLYMTLCNLSMHYPQAFETA